MMQTRRQAMLCVFLLTLTTQLTKAMHRGEECTQSTCSQDRGFINYRITNTETQWSLLAGPGQFKTFVLYLKNVQLQTMGQTWLRIESVSYRLPKRYYINNNEERMLVFMETNEVTITLQRQDVSGFKLDYFVGCDVLEGRDVEIDRSPDTSDQAIAPLQHVIPGIDARTFSRFGPAPASAPVSQSNPTCWFVVPEITEELERTPFENFLISIGYPVGPARTRDIEVQQTYAILQNVSMDSNTTLNVIDILAEEATMSVQGSERMTFSVLEKSNKTVKFQSAQDRTVSTIIFVDLKCDNDEACDEANFAFAANSLRQSDLDCVDRQRKCLFNVGETEYDCAPPALPPIVTLLAKTEDDFATSECPAYDKILSSVSGTLESTVPQDDGEAEGSGTGEKNYRRKLAVCNRYHEYCGTYNCMEFAGQGCARMCFFLKINMRICSFFYYFF